jgi:glyoxylase-like metal-dependent hydrolase (beta-lactamase superfamily II)
LIARQPKSGRTLLCAAVCGALVLVATAARAQQRSAEPAPLRLYVLDGGELVSDPGNYDLSEQDVRTRNLSIAAYLVVHPRGILLWDAFGVADDERQPGGTGTEQTIVRSDMQNRYITLGPPLGDQLAAAGVAPQDVTHLALSHYHWDHTANANVFAHATWLVHANERAEMFGSPGGSARPATYSALATSPTVLVDTPEYDVFGDGRVILKAAPGHSPGHQVLYVALERTGGVVLSGDLYHYPEERSLDRLPVSEYDREQTVASRRSVEDFLADRHATLWIGHDLIAHRALRKSPEFYD